METRERLLAKPAKTTETREGTITYQYVAASDARNWDGSESGFWPESDPRIALEKEIVRLDGSLRIKNFWRNAA